MARVLLLFCVVFVTIYQSEQAHFLSREYINKINSVAKTWTAGINFHPNTHIDEIKGLLGSYSIGSKKIELVKSNDPVYSYTNEIPAEFDARERWQECKSIGTVRDQGKCGSCWALSTTSAFSDRLCIATDGEFNEILSAENLAFCCWTCGFGCNGGFPLQAWRYFKWRGVVTGGSYNTTEGCQPYRVAPCITDERGQNTCDGEEIEKNHKCEKKCYGNTEIDIKKDRRYTRDAYYLTPRAIQHDLMAYGPIEASFDVYSDFISYKYGVYHKTENATLLGGHSVKLIGWGEEEGTPYWLLMNSWNEQWGDNGLFKILRGNNECKIEEHATAGVPYLN
ncbi:cathepsin B-like cysteine proteinase 3 [Daktulosphaira vitifoliae]|uniref:cathepsin B-like cysteine proteinase 3 n=1 Tax=Daktulosphaira vitifoliae TaxID=58002 RepID=UPI0021A9931E|nr:cathepsin B-like cysteine proteinase 3 [Daktulosphaira vitifoliae]